MDAISHEADDVLPALQVANDSLANWGSPTKIF